MGRILRLCVWVSVFCFIASGVEVFVFLNDGTLIQGELEAGIPTNISINLATGGSVFLKMTEIKVIRFYRGVANVEVEDWVGQIYRGEILNLGTQLTVREKGGASRNILQSQITSIMFVRSPPEGQPEPVAPGTGYPASSISELSELYEESRWSFFLGLGYSVAGLVERNRFGYPRNEIGLNSTLGLHWRHFFLPSWGEIENSLSKCGATDLKAAIACLRYSRFLYIQVATDILIYPSLGIGFLVSLGESAFFDVGVLLNLGLLSWWPFPLPYLGVIAVF